LRGLPRPPGLSGWGRRDGRRGPPRRGRRSVLRGRHRPPGLDRRYRRTPRCRPLPVVDLLLGHPHPRCRGLLQGAHHSMHDTQFSTSVPSRAI
jgi:hypothetical protein